jgi:hypothetical protein
MSAAIFEAAIPEPFRILGLRLKPLSLGRYRLLQRFHCAFVAEKEVSAGMADLLLGLLICSMEVREFLEFIESSDAARQLKAWRKKIWPMSWLGLVPWVGGWWCRRRGSDAVEKMDLFKLYIAKGSRTPKYWEEEPGQGSADHWSHAIEVILRSELNWSEREIDEAPLSKALSDYFKWAENKGLVRLMTSQEIEQIEKQKDLTQRREEAKAQGEEAGKWEPVPIRVMEEEVQNGS